MSDELNDLSMNSSPLTAYHMYRPRVSKILARAAHCKLVYVIAGAGYGKTQAVHQYVEKQQDSIVRWLQLTDSDNSGARYWEHMIHSVATDNPDLAAVLREFGFPDTLARFKQFAEIQRTMEHRSKKTFLVLDDFHLIYSKQALTFAERCAHLQIPGACVIIITRKEPDINTVSLMSKGKIGIVTENELRFTENEIIEFLRLRNIPLTSGDLPQLLEVTRGWALAIKLLSLVLTRRPDDLQHALRTMKQNIYKLLETEAFSDFPVDVQKKMVKYSLISDLPLNSLQEITGDAHFMRDTAQLASFMWYDSFIGDYRIHPLYLDFLQNRQNILSESEKLETYRWAAKWCIDNNFLMDAVNYCAKSRQLGLILEILLSYPFKLPYDTCDYIMNILVNIDAGYDEADGKDSWNGREALLLKNLFIPLLLIGMGRYDDAMRYSLNTLRDWENSKAPFADNLIYTAYSNLAYIDLYVCTETHKYRTPVYMKKSVDYYRRAQIPQLKVTGSFAVADIRSYACLVGVGAQPGEIDGFQGAVDETMLYISETPHFMYYGYNDLVACEIAFFRYETVKAGSIANNVILKAREKNQYSIEAMAEQYLLRIALIEGDYTSVKGLITQLRVLLGKMDFWSRQLLFDLFMGFFYIQIGLPELTPVWLIMDEKETTSEIHIPLRELLVGVKYYIAAGKYKKALTLLCLSYPMPPHERFLFGELSLTLLFAVARLKTGDAQGAVEDFIKAYQISLNGEFSLPFIELGAYLQQLAAAVSKRADSGVPGVWLKDISLKASIYAKKTAVIRSLYKEDNKVTDTVQLSEREQEVLNDLYQGLSREEIAANLYLSINTVKKILQSIYIKLDANNNIDAIRIAIEKKLV